MDGAVGPAGADDDPRRSQTFRRHVGEREALERRDEDARVVAVVLLAPPGLQILFYLKKGKKMNQNKATVHVKTKRNLSRLERKPIGSKLIEN